MPKGLVQVVKPKVSLIRPTGSEGPSPKIDFSAFSNPPTLFTKENLEHRKESFPHMQHSSSASSKGIWLKPIWTSYASPSYPGGPEPSKLASSAPSIPCLLTWLAPKHTTYGLGRYSTQLPATSTSLLLIHTSLPSPHWPPAPSWLQPTGPHRGKPLFLEIHSPCTRWVPFPSSGALSQSESCSQAQSHF